MSKYRAIVRDLCYREIFVEAADNQEAWEIVSEADADEFFLIDGGEWAIESINEIE